MLSTEDNDLLTRAGRGTPGGELFRRFWIPVLLSRELPEPDSAPKRIRVLGEDLMAIRLTDGRPAVVARRCPHRGADLFFGRNEQQGIRCAFHGWKFDASGQCVDMPNVERNANYEQICTRMRITAYPARDWGDLVWVYMGPAERMPDLPEMEFATVPASHRYVSKKYHVCNWAQTCEGGLDTAHFSFLHSPVGDEEENRPGIERLTKGYAKGSMNADRLRWIRADGVPRFSIVEHEVGMAIGGSRHADPGERYWRVSQFLLPSHFYAPNTVAGENYHGQTSIPIDDDSCWVYCYTWNPDRPLSAEEVASFEQGAVVHAETDGEGFPVRNRSNDYQIDRVEQKYRSYTGITGISEQDQCIQESQGTIADRTDENLVATDAGVVRFRRIFLDQVRALMHGEEPPAASCPLGYRVRSGSHVAADDLPFAEVMMQRFGDPAGRIPDPLNEEVIDDAENRASLAR